MQSDLRELLEKRSHRAMATILGFKERECDPFLSERTSQQFRKVILDTINDYHALVVDILDSMTTGTTAFNELYLERLDSLEDLIREVASNGG